MAITFTNAAATSLLNNIISQAEAGAGAPLIVIYSGPVPASAEAALVPGINPAIHNVVLAAVPLTDPAPLTVSGKTATMANAPKTDNSADATGSATFFRLTTSEDGATPGTAVLQGSCANSDAELNLNTTNVTAAGPFRIDSLSISLG